MIELTFTLAVLFAIVGFAVIWRGPNAALAPLDSTDFLESEPMFEQFHKESGEIHWSKDYRTESGLPVTILTTGKPGPFPVAGYVWDTGDLIQWDKFGKTQNTESGLNLVEVRS